MRLRIACAVVVVSVLMAGLICPAACALVCAGSHATESQVPGMHHHHACESGTMGMPRVNAQPCHSNCSPAVSGLGSSSVSEGIFRPVALGSTRLDSGSRFRLTSPRGTVRCVEHCPRDRASQFLFVWQKEKTH